MHIFCSIQVCLEKWQIVPCKLLERKKKRVSTALESSIVTSCCSPWQCRLWPYSGATSWSSWITKTKVCGVMWCRPLIDTSNRAQGTGIHWYTCIYTTSNRNLNILKSISFKLGCTYCHSLSNWSMLCTCIWNWNI